MNISDNTLSVLKNFSNINQNLVVKAGNKIRTISPQKTVMAVAQVEDMFDSSFAIYDLNQFLSAISLFEKPDFTFEDKNVVVANGKSSIKYFFAEESMVMTAPDREIELPDTLVEFKLTTDIFKSTMQAASVLQAPNWSVIGNGSIIEIVVGDIKNGTSNNYRVTVGETSEHFDVAFKVDNLKMMQRDYNVAVSSKGISHFTTEKGDLSYFVATEASK
tara:strand:- start:659 stop:1312 length:654 start_codon:yes stop_codon:yes gene_type:complete